MKLDEMSLIPAKAHNAIDMINKMNFSLGSWPWKKNHIARSDFDIHEVISFEIW